MISKKHLLTIIPLSLLALNATELIPIAKNNIGYKEKILFSDVIFVPQSKKFNCKEHIDVNLLRQNKYYSKHFIRKDKAICQRSVSVPEDSTVRFKFGNLEIERDGKIIRETDKYIKIKNHDGTINKIYKDGRN